MILMCTALSFNQFFGRNLDYEFSYGEQVAVTPRNYDFHFRHLDKHESHYAIDWNGSRIRRVSIVL